MMGQPIAIAGNIDRNIAIVLACFAAVEERDEERQAALFHPQAEFLWPPQLPYARAHGPRRVGFEEAWDPYQPSEAERRLDPRVVAAHGAEIVVLWQQRGVDGAGNRFESPVLGLYEIRGGKLVRAQMFYFDPDGAALFLASATPAERTSAAST
jgi:ketosteroid isomerase-like protein